jgi:hypothetical protein
LKIVKYHNNVKEESKITDTRIKMLYKTTPTYFVFYILTITYIIIISSCTQVKTIDLSFEQKKGVSNADEQTIQSIQKISGMYIINYYGDYEDRLKWLNDYHSKESVKKGQEIRCSLFAAYTKSGKSILGRNFDRDYETPVLTKYSAPGKYTSFAFSPASEVFLHEVVKNPNPTEEQKNKLLYCLPFYSTDGINEKGLSIAIAGAPPLKIKDTGIENRIFVLYFIRHVLDNCKNVEEVAQFARTVCLYDSDFNTISHHFIAVDASQKWLIIDYPDGSLKITKGQGTSQVRTNHFLDSMQSIEDNSFRRYNILNSALNSTDTLNSETDAMKLLKKVQNSTKWSVVYESNSCTGTIAVNENYKTQLKFGFN